MAFAQQVGPSRSARLSFRDTSSQDAESLLQMFHQTFGIETSTGRARTTQHWHWKYHENPGGNWSRVIEDEGGRIVAHKGSLPFSLDGGGPGAVAVQSVDHMTRREGLQRVSLFGQLTMDWIDRYGDTERCQFAYGLPSPSDYRVGCRFGAYVQLRSVNLLYGCLPSRRPSITAGVEVVAGGDLDAQVDRLWQRCLAPGALALSRNHRYLCWRYQDHPDVAYRILRAVDIATGALRGLCVYRCGGIATDVLTIMEWLVPEGDECVAQALLAACAEAQSRCDHAGTLAWFPSWSAWSDWFVRQGFRERATEYNLVGRCFDPRRTEVELRERLYLTLGDVDYY